MVCIDLIDYKELRKAVDPMRRLSILSNFSFGTVPKQVSSPEKLTQKGENFY